MVVVYIVIFFFFKQKTAYEMRISDWSSDVCSSDLLGYSQPTDGLMSPQYVIQRIGELTGPEAVYAAGVGQHQMWAAQFIKYERPNAWLNSGGAARKSVV